MAITVANATSHAIATLKLPSTAFSGEEVRVANVVNSRIVKNYRWHWQLTAGTNIAVSAGTQDYSMAAGDQSRVQAIANANLLEGSTEQPELFVTNDPPPPLHTAQGQPTVVGLISTTQVRLWPNPDATYTFKWRYWARPTVLTLSTNNYDCPDSFMDVILAGIKWQWFQLIDDDRAATQEQLFVNMIKEQIQSEQMTTGRMKL